MVFAFQFVYYTCTFGLVLSDYCFNPTKCLEIIIIYTHTAAATISIIFLSLVFQTINTTPLSDPAVVQSTVTAHSNIPHVNSSGHQQSRTARKTLEKQTQLIFPSIFGGSFDPYQYIQSQISSFNKTGDSFRRHYFNQTASDLIGYKRPLWDTRHEKLVFCFDTCKKHASVVEGNMNI